MSVPAGNHPREGAGGGVLNQYAPARELADLDALLATTRAALVGALCISTQDAQAGRTALQCALRLFDERLAGWAADALDPQLRGVTRRAADELEQLVNAQALDV